MTLDALTARPLRGEVGYRVVVGASRSSSGQPSHAFVATILTLTMVGATAGVAAQRRPLLIEVSGPPACPSGEVIAARVAEHLRHVDPAIALPDIRARLAIRDEGPVVIAELTLVEDGVSTVRELRDASCTIVSDAAALVVAMTLVPGLDVAALAEEPEPDRAPAASGLGGAVRLGAHASIGVLPGVVVGGEIAAALRIDVWRAELAVRGVPLVGARFAVDPAVGGDLSIVVALVRGCGVLGVDPHLELLGCVGLEAGAAFGSAVGISAPTDAAAPWVAIEGAVGIAWVPWDVVALVLEVEALVPIVRPVFTISGLGVLYRPEPVGGAMRLALELRFQ